MILPFIDAAADVVVRIVRPSNGGGSNDEKKSRSARTYFAEARSGGRV